MVLQANVDISKFTPVKRVRVHNVLKVPHKTISSSDCLYKIQWLPSTRGTEVCRCSELLFYRNLIFRLSLKNFECIHFFILCKICCICHSVVGNSDVGLNPMYIVKSSAKTCDMSPGSCCMCKNYSKGPFCDPWGTPHFRLLWLLMQSFVWTEKILPLSYDWIPFNATF